MTTSPARAPLVDTHCHLQILDERGLLQVGLESAADAGVEQIVCVGLNVDDSEVCRTIACGHPGVFFTVGWHPHEPAPPDAAQQRHLAELLAHPRAVAVGEIGLDLFFRSGYHETPIEVQRTSMGIMLDLARDAGKPVVLHDRDAHEEILDMVDRWPEVAGVMHCFSGDAAHGARCRERGFLLSFSGIVTFPGSEDIQSAARAVDQDGYVVETDAPFLAPVPHRGRPNVPGYVADTARVLASLRGDGETAVRARTSENARRLFGLNASDRLGA